MTVIKFFFLKYSTCNAGENTGKTPLVRGSNGKSAETPHLQDLKHPAFTLFFFTLVNSPKICNSPKSAIAYQYLCIRLWRLVYLYEYTPLMSDKRS